MRVHVAEHWAQRRLRCRPLVHPRRVGVEQPGHRGILRPQLRQRFSAKMFPQPLKGEPVERVDLLQKLESHRAMRFLPGLDVAEQLLEPVEDAVEIRHAPTP